jgi:hypothetical protein
MTMIVEPGAFRTGFAADAMRHMPMMDAYCDVIGGTRDFAHGMNGTQEGDPAKAALAIATALRSDKTPLRPQLGTDAMIEEWSGRWESKIPLQSH